MKNNKLKKDEIVLYECEVMLDKFESSVNLNLTNYRIIFMQEKGLFKKRLKVVGKIPLKNIKVYKDKVQIKVNKSSVIIQTVNDEFVILCSNFITAKKLAKYIINVKTDSNMIQRGFKKVGQTVNFITDNKDAILKMAEFGYEFYDRVIPNDLKEKDE